MGLHRVWEIAKPRRLNRRTVGASATCIVKSRLQSLLTGVTPRHAPCCRRRAGESGGGGEKQEQQPHLSEHRFSCHKAREREVSVERLWRERERESRMKYSLFFWSLFLCFFLVFSEGVLNVGLFFFLWVALFCFSVMNLMLELMFSGTFCLRLCARSSLERVLHCRQVLVPRITHRCPSAECFEN